MALFQFNSSDCILEGVDRTTFQAEGITERQIQQALVKSISCLLPESLVVCDERGFWEDASRRVDILCLDRNGDLVVVELKRDETAAQADLQALRYAAMISTMSFGQIADEHAKFLSKSIGRLVDTTEAAEALSEFLGWEDSDDDAEINQSVRIVLAATDFSKELTTTALWLNDQGIAIECVRMLPYKYKGAVLVDFHRVIPVPNSDEFRTKLREKALESEIRRNNRDYTKYVLGDDDSKLAKRNLALKILQTWVQQHSPQTLKQLHEAFPITYESRPSFVATLSEAQRVAQTKAGNRHFSEESERLMIGGDQYCVSNQWGKDSIAPLIQDARNIGFQVTESE